MMRITPISVFFQRVAIFAAIVGPGIISAFGNDAGGIAMCSTIGSHFGYTMLWTIIPMTIALIVIQEMAARLGVVTGKGLADLIREHYGVRATFYILVAILLANIGTTVSEFIGIAASLELFGVSKYVSVPLAAGGVWLLVTRVNYKKMEKVFLISALFFVSYLVSGYLSQPQWPTVAKSLIWPQNIPWSSAYLFAMVGLVGTTITPWMQFYLQASVVEKGIRKEDYSLCRIDVIGGCIMTNVITFAIIVTCASTLFVKGIHVDNAASAAQALAPIAGANASHLFAIGLLVASIAGAAILPLTTAFYVCEGMGWEAGIDRTFEEAPQFYSLFGASIFLAAATVLIPKLPLWPMLLFAQVVQGILLPFVLIFMLLLVNKKDLMGDYTNSRLYNTIAWIVVVTMITLTLAMVTTTFIQPG